MSLSLILLGSCLLSCGDTCTLPDLENTIREDTSRPGKVGTLRGLEVIRNAHQISSRHAAQFEPQCLLSVDHRKISIKIVRTRGAVASVWTEDRIVRSESGRKRISSNASFETMIGQEGTRTFDMIWAEGDVFIKEGDEAYYARPEVNADAGLWLREGSGAFQTVVQAVSGWQPSLTGFELGEAPLVCGPVSSGGWLARFKNRGEVLEAQIESTAERREIRAKWALDNGQYLNVTLSEEQLSAESIEIPPAPSIAPDQSFVAAREVLSKMVEDGFISSEDAEK